MMRFIAVLIIMLSSGAAALAGGPEELRNSSEAVFNSLGSEMTAGPVRGFFGHGGGHQPGSSWDHSPQPHPHAPAPSRPKWFESGRFLSAQAAALSLEAAVKGLTAAGYQVYESFQDADRYRLYFNAPGDSNIWEYLNIAAEPKGGREAAMAHMAAKMANSGYIVLETRLGGESFTINYLDKYGTAPYPSSDPFESCGGANDFGTYYPGGDCGAFGCSRRGGGCNVYGCWLEGGGCSSRGCIRRVSSDPCLE